MVRRGRPCGDGLLIAAAIWRFWQLRDHLAEGEAWLTELLAAPSAAAATPARAAGADALASIVYWRGDYAAARERYQDALALYDALGNEVGARGRAWQPRVGRGGDR